MKIVKLKSEIGGGTHTWKGEDDEWDREICIALAVEYVPHDTLDDK